MSSPYLKKNLPDFSDANAEEAFENLIGRTISSASDSDYDTAESHLLDCVFVVQSELSKEKLTALHAAGFEEIAQHLHQLNAAADIFDLAKTI